MNAGVFGTFPRNKTSPTVTCVVPGEFHYVTDLYYAVDGISFINKGLGKTTVGDVLSEHTVVWTLDDVIHKSKVRFQIESLLDPTSVAWLQCSILINEITVGTTAADIAHWSIVGWRSADNITTDFQGNPNRYWNSDNTTKIVDMITFEFSFSEMIGSIDINIDGQVTTNIGTIVPHWQPNINGGACTSIDYFDGISDRFSTDCQGSVEATFEHLSTEIPFKIQVSAGGTGVADFGVGGITLLYGTCNDVLPLLRTDVRFDDTAYTDISDSKLHSISSGYLVGMVRSQLDTYVSSESYIYIGVTNTSNPRWIVRFIDDTIEVWTSTKAADGLFGGTMVSSAKLSSSNIINNDDWFRFYISWDQDAKYFRVGTEFLVNESPLIDLKFSELFAVKGVVIDSIGVMHANKQSKADWNVISFVFIPTTQPKLCWTTQLESVGRKSWINTEMKTIWLTENDEATSRIPTTLTSSLIFNGPFISGESIRKTLVSVYEHDYIVIQARLYGFGEWDVIYPTLLNGLSVHFNNNEDEETLIWFDTYLTNGGSTRAKCNISEYKQWSSWTELESTGKIPLDILTTDAACYYDVNLYLKHNAIDEPFTISFNGDLEDTVCDIEPQFDIQLKDVAASLLPDYPKKLSGSNVDYKSCYALCTNELECNAWMYNTTGYCWLMSASNFDMERMDHYTSGMCDGAYIYEENSTCVCDDCTAGNEYYYFYIESESDLNASYFSGKTLHSHSCDFTLRYEWNFEHSRNMFTLKNVKTDNTLNTIDLSDITNAIATSNKTWTYPIRMILDGPVFSVVDDSLQNAKVFEKQCVVQHDAELLFHNDFMLLSPFILPNNAFAFQFSLDIPTVSSCPTSHALIRFRSDIPILDTINFAEFGWENGVLYFDVHNTRHLVTDPTIKNLAAAGETLYTFRYDGEKNKAHLWAKGQKTGYQSFSNVTSHLAGYANKFQIVGKASATGCGMTVGQICVSDLSSASFKDNSADFDDGMRCWSDKYKNINRHNEFVTSFVSDAGCGSVVSSCDVRYGESLDYISYYDEMRSTKIPNDLDCYVGKFKNPNAPRIHNNLCAMFKKCESPKQSLYTKSWAFSSVNVTTATCGSTTPNITRKIRVQYKDQYAIDDGTDTLTADEVYTIHNGFMVFRLQPIRYPAQGFDNRSVYISLMNSEEVHGQEEANITWTFELNNEFGVKFYRGNRTGSQRFIGSQYIENILSAQDANYVAGYCYGDHLQSDMNITYASDGETFESVDATQDGNGVYSFTLQDVTYASKIHFAVENGAVSQHTASAIAAASAFICSIYVRGDVYSTSSDAAFWTISDAKIGGHSMVEMDQYSNSNSTMPVIDSSRIAEDAKWIWNFECEESTVSSCASERIVFEFAFLNVDNADNEPSFYVEWDSMYGDYIRFGFYNKSKSGIGYNDNSNLIFETGYISNLYTHAIYSDGHFGNNTKIYIDQIMFSIANDSYNLNSDWWVLVNILNTTDPKPCFGYDLMTDQQTRITQRDLDGFSLWKDDGRAMNWKSNGKSLPDWHKIQYLNWTDNFTESRESFPYYFHFPFASKQEKWRRSFSIDEDITYDYASIEFDFFTFCGWNHETDSVSVSLAFEEYLDFAQFWNSTHTHYECEGYHSPTWNNVIDVVRMNNDTHNDLSCYVKGMMDPVYQCNLQLATYERNIAIKENVDTTIQCKAFGANSRITLRYYADGTTGDSSPAPPFNEGGYMYYNATSASRYTLYVENNDLSENKLGGLMCNISIEKSGKTLATFVSNTSSKFWSIIDSSNGNSDVDLRNSTDGFGVDEHGNSKWIWNGEAGASYVEFQFDFANVFGSNYNLSYVNDHKVNISNATNITQLAFEATALTKCKLTFNSNGQNISNITIKDGEYISSDTDSKLQSFIGLQEADYIYVDIEDFEYECRLELFDECEFGGTVFKLNGDGTHNVNIAGNASSWRIYAARGKQCVVRFYSSSSSESWTMEAEDGGMVDEECNPYSIDSANITVMDAHYGCYTRVSFEVPNTNAQPFVLQLSAQMDDISWKFGSFSKSWGFGNVTITPLQCSNFSNIVPLKAPFTLSDPSSLSGSVQLSTNELFSFEHKYLFILINFFKDASNAFSLDIVFGDLESDGYFWKVSLTETQCALHNIKISKSVDCSDNTYFKELMNKVTDSSVQKPQLLYFEWDPYGTYGDEGTKQFRFGTGDSFEDGLIAAEDIYGDDLFGLHYNLDYVTFTPTADTNISIAVVQLDAPKICLSQGVAQLNVGINLGNLWLDDCNQAGWEWTQYAHIMDDTIRIDNQSHSNQCDVTELSSSSNCFYGPFKGSEPLDYGDYVSRYFYIFGEVAHDVISVDLDYHSLCTWNPEQFENDTAYVFINNDAIWKSAPQYEFVEEYCEGYALHESWSLDLNYFDILNPNLIGCLHLLDQICTFPVSFTFRYNADEIQNYFRIGLGAKLNQEMDNEAFAFSNVRIAYESCPQMTRVPIGSLHKIVSGVNGQFTHVFAEGDMILSQNASSRYYVVVDANCTFTLFGGYKMWSQYSSDCKVESLPMVKDALASSSTTLSDLDVSLSVDGVFSLDNSLTETSYHQRTRCAASDAYYYYSMNRTDALKQDWSMYSAVDCDWKLSVTSSSQVTVTHVPSNQVKWSYGTTVKSFVFNSDGYLAAEPDGDLLSLYSADFMVFDGGKLILMDHSQQKIVQQFDFNFAECDAYINVTSIELIVIKYFYFMKPGDILWNGEALISRNCDYKLILQNGKLQILNSSNHAIWTANPDTGTHAAAERLEFLRDGSMVLYSFSQQVIWSTDTSTLLQRNSVIYPDRAILKDDGHFFIIDNASLTVHYSIPSGASVMTSIETEIQSLYDESLSCDSTKYEFVNKEYGFYASWISYFNCDDNLYRKGETTECVAFKYCAIVKHYENIFLDDSNYCQRYQSKEWRSVANDYVLFQMGIPSIGDMHDSNLKPKVSLVLSTNDELVFGNEFASGVLSARTLLITIDIFNHSLTLKTKHGWETLVFDESSWFEDGHTEWLWIQWNVNFNSISIGNSQYISSENAIFTQKYSDFFHDKLNPNENLFSAFNLAWGAGAASSCVGEIVVQLSPMSVDIAKGCFANESTLYIAPMNTLFRTFGPTVPTTPPTMSPSKDPTNDPTTLSPTESPSSSPSEVIGTDQETTEGSDADATERCTASPFIYLFMILQLTSLFAFFL